MNPKKLKHFWSYRVRIWLIMLLRRVCWVWFSIPTSLIIICLSTTSPKPKRSSTGWEKVSNLDKMIVDRSSNLGQLSDSSTIQIWWSVPIWTGWASLFIYRRWWKWNDPWFFSNRSHCWGKFLGGCEFRALAYTILDNPFKENGYRQEIWAGMRSVEIALGFQN